MNGIQWDEVRSIGFSSRRYTFAEMTIQLKKRKKEERILSITEEHYFYSTLYSSHFEGNEILINVSTKSVLYDTGEACKLIPARYSIHEIDHPYPRQFHFDFDFPIGSCAFQTRQFEKGRKRKEGKKMIFFPTETRGNPLNCPIVRDASSVFRPAASASTRECRTTAGKQRRLHGLLSSVLLKPPRYPFIFISSLGEHFDGVFFHRRVALFHWHACWFTFLSFRDFCCSRRSLYLECNWECTAGSSKCNFRGKMPSKSPISSLDPVPVELNGARYYRYFVSTNSAIGVRKRDRMAVGTDCEHYI